MAPFGRQSFRSRIRWSADRQRFALSAGQHYGGGNTIFAGHLDFATGTLSEIRQISPSGSYNWNYGNAIGVEISPDATTIYYGWRDNSILRHEIRRVAFDGTGETVIWRLDGVWEGGPGSFQLSDDGARLWFLTTTGQPSRAAIASIKADASSPADCGYQEAATLIRPGGFDLLGGAAPAADAGDDTAVDEGTAGVLLDGSQSTGVGLTYQWAQVGGSPGVVIEDPTTAVTSFDAPYVGANTTLTFKLTVTDDDQQTDSDTVDITIVSVNDPPVADAGDDFTIKEGATATLDATHSYDPNNDAPLFYEWAQLAGPSVTLDDATSATPSFAVPTAAGQTLTFELVVSDSRESGAPDTVDVVVVSNAAPVADAGADQTKDEGGAVTLSGLDSFDPDGDGLTYLWTQVSGIPVELADATLPTPAFAAPAVGPGGETLVFQLVVTDDDLVNPLSSQPDGVTVSVVSINDPPRCDLARPSSSVLWPPNHKMKPVEIEGVTDPDSEYNVVTLTITGVTQDEPVSALGDGDTSPDAVLGDPATSVLLRSERAGGGNGRVYVLSFTASDGFEGCSGSVAVGVPHDRNGTAQDDGQAFDSTQP